MSEIKLVAFDVDGTLTEGNIWKRVNEAIGITPEEDLHWFLDYYNRKITFSKWADIIQNKYLRSGKTRQELEKIMEEVTFVPGAPELIKQLQTKYSLYLVSSGIDIYVKEVANILGITHYHANYSFVYDEKQKIIAIDYAAPEDKAKVRFLKSLCRDQSILPQEIAYVGDSSNDLGAFEFTGRGILVGLGNDKLRQAAWKQVNTLSEVASILKR